MKLRTVIIAISAATIAAIASSASAEILTITLTGDQENINNSGGVFGSDARITDASFVQTFTVNTYGGNAAHSPTFLSFNSFFGANPPYAVGGSLTINGETISTLGSNYSYIAANATDYYMESNDVVPNAYRSNNDFSLDLHGTGLPTTVTGTGTYAIDGSVIEAFDSFTDEASGGEFADASGTLSPTHVTIAVTFVPEPATWALMIGGSALMGGTLRRRRRRATLSAA